jgi:sugar lactone lactonase YvrE
LNTAYGPNEIAVAGGVTYVAEGGENLGASELQIFGSSPSAWTSYGVSTFVDLGGVACNSAGTTVYVLDGGDEYDTQSSDGTAYVYAFTSSGATIASWYGYGSTQFFAPDGIAVDAQGNVYVADAGNGLLEEFGPTGTPETTWSSYNGTAFTAPEALAFDASGNLYVGDYGPYTSPVEVVYEFSGNNSTGPTKTGVNQWAMVPNCLMSGIGVDGSGNLYVADYGAAGVTDVGNGLVEEFAPNGGSLSTEWASGTNFGPACVLSTGGSLLVGDWNNNLLKIFN